jgi:Zn-dependent protease with chaperone function
MLASLLISWSFFYDVTAAFDGGRRGPNRQAFLAEFTRHYLLLPLVPISAVLMHADLLKVALPSLRASWFGGLAHGVPILILVLFFPYLLRQIWRAEPLPNQALRRRLFDRARQLNVGLRDILIWKTNHRTRNAALSGICSPVRQVFLTDRLLSDLSDDDIERVFLHEIAHAKLRHGLKLTCVTVVALAATVNLTVTSDTTIARFVPLCITVLSLGLLVRLFEFEADLWAAQLAGPEAYVRTLNLVSGGGDWLHPTLKQRQRMVLTDEGEQWPKLQARIGLTWITVCLVTLVALAQAWPHV